MNTEELQENEPLKFESRVDMSPVFDKLLAVRNEINKVIVGQERMVDLLLVSMLANGHVLLEGVPGVAKTITARLLAKTLDTSFARIQFTPDLMPSDILGTLVFDVKKSDFEYRKGPIFANIILIDEINRGNISKIFGELIEPKKQENGWSGYAPNISWCLCMTRLLRSRHRCA